MGAGADLLKDYKDLEKSGFDVKQLIGFEKFGKTLEEVDNLYWKSLVPKRELIESYIENPREELRKTALNFFADKAEFQKKLAPIEKDFWAYLTILSDKMRSAEKKQAASMKSMINVLRVCEVMFGKGRGNPLTADESTIRKEIQQSAEKNYSQMEKEFIAKQEREFKEFVEEQKNALKMFKTENEKEQKNLYVFV